MCYDFSNLRSKFEYIDVVREKLQKEVSLGSIAGSFPIPSCINLRVSLLGVVPKKESS